MDRHANPAPASVANAPGENGLSPWLWDASILNRPELWCFEMPVALQSPVSPGVPDVSDWPTVARTTPSLRRLRGHDAFFDRITAALDKGPGFAILRRIPVDRLEYREARLLHLQLAKCFGRPMSQDASGTVFCDVVDPDVPGDAVEDCGQMGRRWNDLPLHTDQAFGAEAPRVLAFLCFRAAGRGGAIRLASAAGLMDRVAREDPELLAALTRPVPFLADRQLDRRDPALPEVPVVSAGGGQVVFRYLDYQIDYSRVSEQQKKALKFLKEIVSREGGFIKINVKDGDILLINNARVLHGRDSYENMLRPRAPRHHLRVWLA